GRHARGGRSTRTVALFKPGEADSRADRYTATLFRPARRRVRKSVKRLLVTGVHGFVGRTLARMVESEARLADWQLLDAPATVDLRNPDDAALLVGRHPPDAVIHLAA